MKEIILKNIEKALLRIALSLEKKNTSQLNFKIDEKCSVFIWDPDENYLKAVNKVILNLDNLLYLLPLNNFHQDPK